MADHAAACCSQNHPWRSSSRRPSSSPHRGARRCGDHSAHRLHALPAHADQRRLGRRPGPVHGDRPRAARRRPADLAAVGQRDRLPPARPRLHARADRADGPVRPVRADRRARLAPGRAMGRAGGRGRVARAVCRPGRHRPGVPRRAPPLPGWRPVAIGAAVSFAGLVLALAFTPGPFAEPFAAVERPVPTLPAEWIFAPFWLGTLASLFAAAWAARVRLHRAVGRERRQLLWLAYGALSIPATLVVCALDYALTGDTTWLTAAAVMAMELAIPIAIGIAILRYRLFDIELVLSRTLVYGILTACVVAVYVGVVGGLGSLVDARGALGLVATGIVAIGVQPLRCGCRRGRSRVYGDRNDPYAALSRLGERLQATLAPEAVTAVDRRDRRRGAAGALRRARVRARRAASSRSRRRAARSAARARRSRSPTRAGRSGGWPSGRAAGRELSAADRRLLADLASHAGVALHGVTAHGRSPALARATGLRPRGGAPAAAPRPPRRPGPDARRHGLPAGRRRRPDRQRPAGRRPA